MDDIREGTCPLCKHFEIVVGSPLGFAPIAPIAVTQSANWREHPALLKQYGILETYTCRSCGFTQWFATEPRAIPVGDEYRTKLIKGPEPSGPYR